MYSTLNGLRGVAAIAVLILHGQGFFGRWTPESAYLAVDFFFVMSGFVIASAYEERFKNGLRTSQFFWMRAIRFYPLYVIGAIIGSVSAALAWRMGAGELNLFGLVSAIVLGLVMLPSPDFNYALVLYPTNVPGWSLFYEIAINVFYVAFWKKLTNTVLILTVSIAAVMLIASAFHFGNLDIGAYWQTFIGGSIRVYFSFFLGVIIYRFGLPRLGPRILSWTPLFIIAALFTVHLDGAARIFFDLFCVLFLFPAIVMLAASIEPTRISQTIFEYIGEASFAVYAIHAPIFEMARRAVRMYGHSPAAFSPGAGVALLVLIFFAALALSRYYDPLARRILSNAIRSRLQDGPQGTAFASARSPVGEGALRAGGRRDHGA